MTEGATSLSDEQGEVSVGCFSAETLDNVKIPNDTTKHQKADFSNCRNTAINFVQIGSMEKQLKENSYHMLINGHLNDKDSSSNSIQLKSPIMEGQPDKENASQHVDSQTASNWWRSDECCQSSKEMMKMNVDLMKTTCGLVENLTRMQKEDNARRQQTNTNEGLLCMLMNSSLQCQDQLGIHKGKVETLEKNVGQLEEDKKILQDKVTGLEAQVQTLQGSADRERKDNKSKAEKIVELEQQLQVSQNNLGVEQEKRRILEQNNETQAKKIAAFEEAVANAKAGAKDRKLRLSQIQLNGLLDRVHFYEARDSLLRRSLVSLQVGMALRAQTPASQIPPNGLGVIDALHVQAEYPIQLD